ncbi:MAG: hypothetical protein GY754_45225 [bacterium]|nr:hypothetical protein [bacterium]
MQNSIKKITIHFIIQLGELDEHGEDKNRDIDAVTANEVLTYALRDCTGSVCCSLLGGFAVDINGRPWNGYVNSYGNNEYFYDEFCNAADWVKAFNRLLGGEKEAGFWFEETAYDMRIIAENTLEIKGKAFGEQVGTVGNFNLEAFSKEMLKESLKFENLIQAMQEEIDLMIPAVGEQVGDRLEQIARHLAGYNLEEANKRLKTFVF